MFGNRKRKLHEDEESLVPHGLIWHATVEPTPEEVAKNEKALGYTVNYAQEIERARREQSAQPIEQAPDALQAPPAKPLVMPWWRVESPEATIERPISKPAPMPLSAYVPTPIQSNANPAGPARIQPVQNRPMPVQPAAPEAPPVHVFQASAPRVEGALAKSIQVYTSPTSEPVHNPPVPNAQAEERLVPMSSEITDALALAFSRLRSAGKNAWLSLGSVSGKAVQRGRQTVQSLELGEGLARVGKQGQSLMRGGMARTRYYARATGGALGTFSRAGVSRARQISARVRTASTPATGDVIRPANTQPTAPSRVRELLAASALQVRIITAQRLSAWRIRRERMAVDSRFWASMTLSAIAAIIALVIVSVVPHYAAKSLPSRILNTNPSVDANVAAPVDAATAPVHKMIAPVRKTATAAGTKTMVAKTDLGKTDSAKAAANPKPKHVVHDDYVAPNTYKYYGTGSKASR